MFNIKTIEENIDGYSRDEMRRKIDVVVIKSRDLEEEIENLLKEVNDLEQRNIVLESNMHVSRGRGRGW